MFLCSIYSHSLFGQERRLFVMSLSFVHVWSVLPDGEARPVEMHVGSVRYVSVLRYRTSV